MTAIVDFPTFIEAARHQGEPQRLLFLFLRTGLPEDYDAEQEARFHAGEGGALLPVMYVDKRPEDLTDFETLAEEARAQGESWNMVLAAALSGRNGVPPSAEQNEEALRLMVKTVHAGGDLSAYLAFDSQGEPLRFG